MPQHHGVSADTNRVIAGPSIPQLQDERGFTLIEVLAAMLILLVGVLGSVSLIDGANATTSFTKGREGATNLARELIETSRSIDYDKVTAASIAGQLQTKPGLADAASASGWQIKRRGITFTVTPSACTFDDATDNTAAQDATFCSNSATAPAGDANPDDYRRVTFEITWTDRRNRVGKVSQTGVITNPSGGLGPRILAFNPPTVDVLGESTTQVAFTVTTGSADAVRWSADDGSSDGDATGGPTAWAFSWQLGTVGTFSCSSAATWTLDGDYLVTAQAFDDRGVPGDLRARNAHVDRSAPAPPCGLEGGRNGSRMELRWLANAERDIAGYRVFRVKIGSEVSDPQVCSLTTKTECHDDSPPDSSVSPVSYYVVAYDSLRQTPSAIKLIAQTSNAAPSAPPQLTGTVVDGLPTLTWTAASDSDGSIQFYRVYRDGTAITDRYDATSGPQLSYTDKSETGHQYWVTAVDDKFAESAPVGPVTP